MVRKANDMHTLVRVLLLTAVLAVPALPQSAELGISVGYGRLGDNVLSASSNQAVASSEAYSLSNGVRVGGRMVFNSRAFLSHEISYAYQHARLEVQQEAPGESLTTDLGAVRAHNMFYNLQLHALPSGSLIRPFVTGGGGFTSFFLPGIPSFSGYGDTKFGYNYGAGIKLNFYTYGIRVDFRNHTTGKPFRRYIPGIEGMLNNTEISVTYSLLL